ncbi:DUF4476 domain-containing protein [Flavobacterium sp.]|uniref:DUF4476 domain-containing protein n=1 Tax=Flavobacterium sp. TaxID=239 RepID=UPI0024871E3C|nr:DUF4476 domain-containing protein [Flavobacterium sp.]MDI1315689.1 DUF4476 domain-containing protein [Flavobacterium sp.]
MKRTITLIAVLMISAISFAQFGPYGHLNVFSEDGDKFTLILNGEVINDVPQSNLRVEELNQPYYNAKVKFADNSLMDLSKNNLMITDVDGIFMDVTYKIRRDKNNKTKMKLNYFSSIPVRPDFIPPSSVHVIHYGQPAPPPVRGVVSQTTTTTQTDGVNIGVGVNVGGVNMGISINDNMGGGSVTQTTTTTAHSGHPADTGYAEPVRGCGGRACMTSGNFNAALATIKKQSFEETRLKTAKQVITANCLNVDQIILIANTFNFEDNKLDFAKYAYDFCIEPRNYFKLNGIFSFSSNVDELSDYVQSRQ